MDKRVKTQIKKPARATPPARRYDASRRRAAALETRRAIAEAARQQFVKDGYAATTMAAIAASAGVSHETVYAMFGPKPALLRYLVEIAISGTDEPVPALERESTRAMQAEPDPERMMAMFAHVVRLLQERLAPLFEVLNTGAQTDADLKIYADELAARRARDMRLLVAELASRGGVRSGLSLDIAADVVWIFNSPEFYLLCVRDRGWTPDFFEQWLFDSFRRLLLPERP